MLTFQAKIDLKMLSSIQAHRTRSKILPMLQCFYGPKVVLCISSRMHRTWKWNGKSITTARKALWEYSIIWKFAYTRKADHIHLYMDKGNPYLDILIAILYYPISTYLQNSLNIWALSRNKRNASSNMCV